MTGDVAAHSERVVRFCLSIARELKVPEDELVTIELAARFHDIGKIATPAPVLGKPAGLAPRRDACRREIGGGHERGGYASGAVRRRQREVVAGRDRDLVG